MENQKSSEKCPNLIQLYARLSDCCSKAFKILTVKSPPFTLLSGLLLVVTSLVSVLCPGLSWHRDDRGMGCRVGALLDEEPCDIKMTLSGC